MDAIKLAFLDAAKYGHLEVLRMLLKRGADKRLVNEALSRAAGSGVGDANEADLNDVIRFLLKQGADVNAKDDAGWTALLETASI